METRKPIQVDVETHEILRLEALRLGFKRGENVTMGEIIADFAEKLNKKHSHVKAKLRKGK
jgi:hypothetical protein